MDSVTVDQDSGLEARYAKYFKVGHNAPDFLLQFGQFHPGSNLLWLIHVVIGPLFVKELKRILDESIYAYEAQYGEIPAPDANEHPHSGKDPAKGDLA